MDEKIKQIKNNLRDGAINFFGLPYSGKDTIGKMLAEILGAKFIASGDVVRANAEKLKNSENSDLGLLAPTNDYQKIMKDFLMSQKQTGALVLSSIGRWHGEEESIMQSLSEAGHPLRAVIYLKISEEEIWRRWQKAKTLGDRGVRADDNSRKILKKRIAEFKEKTLPVIEHYHQLGILYEIDGEKARENVLIDVLSALAQS